MDQIESIEVARKRHNEMNTAWWDSYIKYGKKAPETVKLKAELDELAEQAVKQFAKPQVSDCEACKWYSVFGGPSHDASSFCRSGKTPRCTCNACY